MPKKRKSRAKVDFENVAELILVGADLAAVVYAFAKVRKLPDKTRKAMENLIAKWEAVTSKIIK